MKTRSLILLSLLTGCSTFTWPTSSKEFSLSQGTWMQYASDRRGALVVPKSSNLITCSEPVPDVSLEISTRFLAQASVPQVPVDASVSSDINQKVIELAGRSQTILFLREALFRLCEQYMNGALSEAEVRELYPSVINASVEFSKALQGASAAAEKRAAGLKVEAEAKRANAKANLAKEIKDLPNEKLKLLQIESDQ